MNTKIKFKLNLIIAMTVAAIYFLSGDLTIRAKNFSVRLPIGTSVKTFDFGAGGDNPSFRSHARSFAAPSQVAIVIAVNYRTTNDAPIPLLLEIEDATDRVVSVREITAEKNAQRVIVNIAAAENKTHGCENGWQVRIRTKSGEVPTARINGDISFSFVDPTVSAIDLTGGAANFKLGKGEQLTRGIGDAESFRHPGVLSVRAGWLDALTAQPAPLKFEIVRPDGTIAKTLTGYGTNSNGNPKLDFIYNAGAADAKLSGAWMLRVINQSDRELIEIAPKVSFTKKCVE